MVLAPRAVERRRVAGGTVTALKIHCFAASRLPAGKCRISADTKWDRQARERVGAQRRVGDHGDLRILPMMVAT